MIDNKLENFAQREVMRNIRSMIIDLEQGGFLVFGRYQLVPAGSAYAVNYLSGDRAGVFSSKRTAISWCVADNFNKLNLARQILTLDNEKQSRWADLNQSRALAERSRHEIHAELILTKMQTKQERYDSVAQELEKCVDRAKYLQIKGFNNETARTSGNDSYKTNL